MQLQRTIESPIHHTRLSEARVHLHIGSKSVLVAHILTQLESLVQAPHVIQELHHDAQRVAGGSNARRSYSSKSRRPSSTFCFFAQTSKSDMYMMPSGAKLWRLFNSSTPRAKHDLRDSRNSTPLAWNTFRGQRWHSPTHSNLATLRQGISTPRWSYSCLGHTSWPVVAFTNVFPCGNVLTVNLNTALELLFLRAHFVASGSIPQRIPIW